MLLKNVSGGEKSLMYGGISYEWAVNEEKEVSEEAGNHFLKVAGSYFKKYLADETIPVEEPKEEVMDINPMAQSAEPITETIGASTTKTTNWIKKVVSGVKEEVKKKRGRPPKK